MAQHSYDIRIKNKSRQIRGTKFEKEIILTYAGPLRLGVVKITQPYFQHKIPSLHALFFLCLIAGIAWIPLCFQVQSKRTSPSTLETKPACSLPIRILSCVFLGLTCLGWIFFCVGMKRKNAYLKAEALERAYKKADEKVDLRIESIAGLRQISENVSNISAQLSQGERHLPRLERGEQPSNPPPSYESGSESEIELMPRPALPLSIHTEGISAKPTPTLILPRTEFQPSAPAPGM